MFLLLVGASVEAQRARPEIEIQVEMRQPWTHYFEVTMTVSGIEKDSLDFIMPVWTPGSYLVREFARNVQEFSAVNDAGRALTWEKIDKNTWRVASEKSPSVTVKYRVYAFEVSVRTSFLDDSHGYINGTSLFMYVAGFLQVPYRVVIHPYSGWNRISTGLEPVADREHTFSAPDFDVLVDCPIEVGNQKILEFKVRNILHYISIYGDGNYEPEKLRSDIQKIVETAAQVVDEIPYRHYTFLLQLLPEGGGGLEHLNSTSLQVSRWSFRTDENYRKFLGLVSHEYFHLWNVKRIRPQALGPFDYARENYTRMLWVSEGFTDYFGYHILRRSGLITVDEYLEGASKEIQLFQETPGRLVDSAADASFDAWIKHYRRDEHSPNATISYYTKGDLIGLVMDLEIRHRTQATKSLDDVMRLLYNRYYKASQRGFTDAEFRQACEKVAGGSLAEIFDGYAYGTKEIDFARYLDYAGLKFADPKKDEKTRTKGYLGISVRASEGKLFVTEVTASTPAYEQGLNVHDEIIALDGYRANQEELVARIEEKSPGTRVEMTIARAGKIRALPIVLGEKRITESKIIRVSNPSAEQKILYESWLHATWEPPKPVGNNDK